MPSEMWTRLKTARKAANLTQLQLAKALGITRSGYAFLETHNDAARTIPNITQLRTISEVTGVPLDLIVDNNTELTDIVRSMLPGYVHKPRAAPAEAPRSEPGELHAMFWGAVRFACHMRGITATFDAQVAPSPLNLRVDYLTDRVISVMQVEPSSAEAMRAIGQLLAAEKALSRDLTKVLLVFARGQTDIRAASAQAKATFGVQVRVVTSAEQAADSLAHIG